MNSKDMIRVGNKLYGVCDTCQTLVQLNKRIFKSLHICDVTNEGTA